MAIQQRTGFSEKREQIFTHLRSARDVSGDRRKERGSEFSGGAVRRAVERSTQRRALPRRGNILSRGVICRLSGVLHASNNFDFHICAFGQTRDLDSGTSGRFLLEIRAVDLIHGWKIAKIGEENCCLDHTVKTKPLGSQHSSDVVQNASSLCVDIAGNNLAGFGIERNLAAAKEETSAPHRLRVGTDRRWRFVGGNDLLHVADCNCKAKSNNQRFLQPSRKATAWRATLLGMTENHGGGDCQIHLEWESQRAQKFCTVAPTAFGVALQPHCCIVKIPRRAGRLK